LGTAEGIPVAIPRIVDGLGSRAPCLIPKDFLETAVASPKDFEWAWL